MKYPQQKAVIKKDPSFLNKLSLINKKQTNQQSKDNINQSQDYEK